MITKTEQKWTVGKQVRVGFLTLKVTECVPTPGDGKPDAYMLESLDGSRLYRFVPHIGIERVE